MHTRATAVVATALLVWLLPTAALAITAYSQDFESLDQGSTSALANDGWLVYGNVELPDGTYLYGYGPFAAPNDGAAFCQIALGESGPEQGEQVLVVFSDYNNQDHGNGYLIESIVYQEQTIDAGAVGETWRFAFQAKRGNLEGQSTASAFIKTIDPGNNYATSNLVDLDMTTIPQTWGGYQVTLAITEDLVGQLIQFGFDCTATDYQGSAVFYDNLLFEPAGNVDVPDAGLAGAELGQNFPNPFNPSTRIEFSLEQAGSVSLRVHDLAGRHVATLASGEHAAGPHAVVWSGRTDGGRPVASGLYRYTLRTAEGSATRNMLLTK